MPSSLNHEPPLLPGRMSGALPSILVFWYIVSGHLFSLKDLGPLGRLHFPRPWCPQTVPIARVINLSQYCTVLVAVTATNPSKWKGRNSVTKRDGKICFLIRLQTKMEKTFKRPNAHQILKMRVAGHHIATWLGISTAHSIFKILY